ncbi:MAG: PIN domain-containing protein [bacterium]|nr:PIN domain-containing protein [bacterium]
MKMVIDSSVFVAAFREDEPHSREAFAIIEKLEAGAIDVIIPVSIVMEVVAAIRRRTNNQELARQVGEKILSYSNLSLIDIDTFRMAKFLELASESGLRGMDTIVVGVAREFSVTLVTLDVEMAEIARRYVDVESLMAK